MSFQFFDHSRDVQPGSHALLSASKYSWTNYDTEKLMNYMAATYATTIGTIVHELAADLIKAKIKVTKNDARKMILLRLLKNDIPRNLIDPDKYIDTFVPYVNDAIGFDMSPEVVLKYLI